MDYVSTRDENRRVSAAAAILEGIAPDGGLYTPATIPELKTGRLSLLRTMGYAERAAWLLRLFLENYTPMALLSYAEKAYASFSHDAVTPVVPYGDRTFILELFHGPTCAFKDVALQILPYLMTAAAEACNISERIEILVATSGDTGKAALEGFADVQGTGITVFYPEKGVSETQKRQMVTQEGDNVRVIAVRGNFDDTQRGVKTLFGDAAFNAQLREKGIRLSSANSINWGRLVPQIVYYISAYCDLLNTGAVRDGEKINICVPTGNFGNILAAYYAMRMGLPVAKLICASNANNVLTEFLSGGTYESKRPFFTTASPSMDILISSNVERLLFELNEHDSAQVAQCMAQLSEQGKYVVPPIMEERMRQVFAAGWCSDTEAAGEIRRGFRDHSYLADTHTAVALRVLRCYREETGDTAPALVAATASPFKFAPDVYAALDDKRYPAEHAYLRALSDYTGLPVPAPITALDGKPVRFTQVIERSAMRQAAADALGV